MKSSTYCFNVKRKILKDFQTWISVPLIHSEVLFGLHYRNEKAGSSVLCIQFQRYRSIDNLNFDLDIVWIFTDFHEVMQVQSLICIPHENFINGIANLEIVYLFQDQFNSTSRRTAHPSTVTLTISYHLLGFLIG